jgi:hypothetical protein
MIYLAGWIVASAGVFAAGKRLCEPGMPPSYRLILSVAAGSIWPLLVVGAVELSSVAFYSSAEHFAAMKGPDSPFSQVDAEQTYGVVTPLR